MENFRIGIIGNIGAGKSTLVKAAKEKPFCDILMEHFPSLRGNANVHSFKEEFNPNVLDAFYTDPIKNAFLAQIEFLNGRLERQKAVENCRGIVLEDRTLAEDYHVFGKAQYNLGSMTKTEFESYQRTFNLMYEKVREPDVIVYLRADLDTLLERIALRGRESEKKITREYLSLLNELYEEFIQRYVTCPVIIINANEKIDLDIYLSNVFAKISDKIQQLDLRITSAGISEWVTLSETQATLRAIKAEQKLEKFLHHHPCLINVAGNVGLGKSTLTAIIEHSLNIKALYENPVENPLLEKFLNDKAKYCYDLQLDFLKIRSKQRLLGKNGEYSCVKDRSLPEDILIFCQMFYEDGHLTRSELDMLSCEFKKVNKELPSSDLLIVLKGSSEKAWKHIQQRGREIEVEGGWSYSEIRTLGKLYENFPDEVIKFGYHNGPVLVLNVDKLDLTNRIHVGYVFEKIFDSLQPNYEKKMLVKKQESSVGVMN